MRSLRAGALNLFMILSGDLHNNPLPISNLPIPHSPFYRWRDQSPGWGGEVYELLRLVMTAQIIKLLVSPCSTTTLWEQSQPSAAHHITKFHSLLISGWLVAVNKEEAYKGDQRTGWYVLFLLPWGLGVPDGGEFHTGFWKWGVTSAGWEDLSYTHCPQVHNKYPVWCSQPLCILHIQTYQL